MMEDKTVVIVIDEKYQNRLTYFKNISIPKSRLSERINETLNAIEDKHTGL